MKSAPVPGAVDACVTLLRVYGTKSIGEAVAPTLRLLDKGGRDWYDKQAVTLRKLTEAERNSLVEAYIARNAQAYALIDPARLSHTIGDSVVDPSQYVVRLSYDATDLPIWNLYPPLPLPGKTIAYGATIRRGGL